MWKTGIISFLVLTLICVISCARGEELPPGTEGVGTSFNAPGGTKAQCSFHLAPGEEFEAEITVRSSSDHRMDLLVTLLLDYEQVAFWWDGTEGFTHCFSLHKRESQTYTLKTPALSEGYHEFILLLFLHPFCHSPSLEWRLGSDKATCRRANLYVGDVSHPAKELPLYTGREVYGSVLPFFLTHEEEVEERPRVWCQESVEPGEAVNYFVYLGNSRKEEKPFALVYFLNYRQIPPNPDADSMVTSGTLPGYTHPTLEGYTQARIPASFKAPEEPGPYELVVIWVRHPYAMLENPPGVLAVPPRIDSSTRTLIMVEED